MWVHALTVYVTYRSTFKKYIEDWVGPRASLGVLYKKKIIIVPAWIQTQDLPSHLNRPEMYKELRNSSFVIDE
jgi:hypothetical protein